MQHILGHTAIKQHLANSVLRGRISHAQLFIGPEGSTALPLAIAYASMVNCQNPQTTGGCGNCDACYKSSKFIHPDIHFSYPTVGTKAKSTDFIKPWRQALSENQHLSTFNWLQTINADNKQGNINVEECEDIFRKLSFTAFEGKYKILIMWRPEFLGKEGNRLLKLLEEPPDNTLFILVAENPDALLNTIVSRTQILRIPGYTDAEIAQYLTQFHQTSPQQATLIAAVAEGNLNTAIHLLEAPENDYQNLLLQWWQVCLKPDVAGMYKTVEAFAELGREAQKHFLQYNLYFFRHTLTQIWGQTQGPALNTAEWQMANQISLKLKLNTQAPQAVAQLLNQAIGHIERNANPRILFMHLSLMLYKTFKPLK